MNLQLYALKRPVSAAVFMKGLEGLLLVLSICITLNSVSMLIIPSSMERKITRELKMLDTDHHISKALLDRLKPTTSRPPNYMSSPKSTNLTFHSDPLYPALGPHPSVSQAHHILYFSTDRKNQFFWKELSTFH